MNVQEYKHAKLLPNVELLQVVCTLDSYSGGLGFKSWPEDWQSLVLYLSLPRKILELYHKFGHNFSCLDVDVRKLGREFK